MLKEKNMFSDFDFFPGGITLSKAAELAFGRLSFTFTKEHLERIIKAALSADASENDRYVLSRILKNADVASRGLLPLCQDTGIASVYGWRKGNPNIEDAGAQITEGARKIYDERRLRFSTTLPSSFYDEFDPQDNLPAQISLFESDCSLAPAPPFVGDAPEDSLSLIFCAKGGGSSNKTRLIQGTKASLTKDSFSAIMKEEISRFGTSACPPYTIAVVAGGLSPEQNLLALKLASMGAYDEMSGEPGGHGFRDRELESIAMEAAAQTGYGAQFGGTKFAVDAVVVRLPRHGASCPISFGVSCAAHRNLRAVLTKEGLYLQKTVARPAELDGFAEAAAFKRGKSPESRPEISVSSDGDISKVLASLSGSMPGDRVILSGKILVARDAAHARWQKLLDSGKNLPEYTKKYPICYAGPARTPDGEIIGSFGPTTAGRMDVYAESLMGNGASLVTLAKGNRSGTWTDACRKYGAFYLGTPGGIAALIASEYIANQKIIDYEDLGMEAVRLIEVRNLPCFVITDKDGRDFYGRQS